MDELQVWEPGHKYEGGWALYSLFYDEVHTKIRLCRHNSINGINDLICLTYGDARILSLNVIEESCFSFELRNLLNRYERGFIFKNSFFQVNNSSKINAIVKRSACIIPEEHIKHLMIRLSDHFIEIISDEWPEIASDT